MDTSFTGAAALLRLHESGVTVEWQILPLIILYSTAGTFQLFF